MRKPLTVALSVANLCFAFAQAPLGVPPANRSICPSSHPVKGNIVERGADKGEKIYHTRASRSYARTQPERCFKDTAEAQRAGYRAPKK